jgi:hypothetical protein
MTRTLGTRCGPQPASDLLLPPLTPARFRTPAPFLQNGPKLSDTVAHLGLRL